MPNAAAVLHGVRVQLAVDQRERRRAVGPQHDRRERRLGPARRASGAEHRRSGGAPGRRSRRPPRASTSADRGPRRSRAHGPRSRGAPGGGSAAGGGGKPQQRRHRLQVVLDPVVDLLGEQAAHGASRRPTTALRPWRRPSRAARSSARVNGGPPSRAQTRAPTRPRRVSSGGGGAVPARRTEPDARRRRASRRRRAAPTGERTAATSKGPPGRGAARARRRRRARPRRRSARRRRAPRRGRSATCTTRAIRSSASSSAIRRWERSQSLAFSIAWPTCAAIVRSSATSSSENSRGCACAR